jgi:branched-chain amino acid transport system ATP-binding protein
MDRGAQHQPDAGGVPEMTPLLEVSDLQKSFAGIRAVDGLSFALASGSITGLIGPNGSGKTTTIDCISGFQQIDAGQVRLAGIEIARLSPHRIARLGLMRTFQMVQLYDGLSVLENLLIAAQQADDAGWIDELLRSARYRRAVKNADGRARELLEIVGLLTYADARAGVLSYGQKKLVSLAAALMPHPKIVLLDEPVAGVNPARIREVEAVLRRLNSAGETFLIVEHNVEFITNLCQQVIVMEQGRKLAEGPAGLIHDDPRVLEAYLGITPDPSNRTPHEAQA